MPDRVLLMAAALFRLALPAVAADTQPDLLEAARKGKTPVVASLLAKGADLEMRDRNGRTPLMLAAQYGRTATVKLLLAKGATPDARDRLAREGADTVDYTPDQVRGFIHSEIEKFSKLVKDAGVTPD